MMDDAVAKRRHRDRALFRIQDHESRGLSGTIRARVQLTLERKDFRLHRQTDSLVEWMGERRKVFGFEDAESTLLWLADTGRSTTNLTIEAPEELSLITVRPEREGDQDDGAATFHRSESRGAISWLARR